MQQLAIDNIQGIEQSKSVMAKHFLMAMSDNQNALYGVQFYCSFFSKQDHHQITLLHVCSIDLNNMNSVLNSLWQDPMKKNRARMSPKAIRAFEKTKRMIKGTNLSVSQVDVMTPLVRYGIAKDILEEGDRGLYDAVLLGRKATYILQWLFERPAEEIPEALIRDHRFTSPIWICPECPKERRNVLACVDGSENGYRVVDHVGYILTDQDQHNITIMHVKNRSRVKSTIVFQRSLELLEKHGISRDRISTISPWGWSVANCILNEVENNNYAAVSIGLHGIKTNHHQRGPSLAGETARKLIRKIEHTSIWCVP